MNASDQDTLKMVTDLLAHHQRIADAGADDTTPAWGDLGPDVTLWRRFRDGSETREVLPEFLAEVTLASIVEREPDVARAKIEREVKQ